MNNRIYNIKYFIVLLCITTIKIVYAQKEMESDRYYVEWNDTLVLRCDHFLLTYEYIHSIPESERPEKYKYAAFISITIYCFKLKKIKIDGEKFRMYKIVAVMFPYKSYCTNCDGFRINGVVNEKDAYDIQSSNNKECHSLRHEKIHFDIEELYARKIRQFLSYKKFDEKYVYSIVNYYLSKAIEMHNEFDNNEIINKSYEETLSKWENKLKSLLDEYKKYANPIIYVRE